MRQSLMLKGILAITVISLSGCQTEKPSLAKFDQPDVPFTFTYPEKFFSRAMVQFRPGEALGNKPSYYFEIEENNGIGVRQISNVEASNQEIINQLKTSGLPDSKAIPRLESHAGREMVVLEQDIKFATSPPSPGHSKSYFFGYNGKTWQIEFYSTSKGNDAVNAASRVVMESIEFK